MLGFGETRELSLVIICKFHTGALLQLLYLLLHHSGENLKNLATVYPNIGRWWKGWRGVRIAQK